MLSVTVYLLATAFTVAAAEEIKLFAKTEGQIISYPDSRCKTGECIWKIETDETKVVKFEVVDGKLEETEEECERSSLEAFDGPTLEALKVRQLCVKMEAIVRKKPHHCTWSSGRHLMLRFHQHPQDMTHHFTLRFKSVPREEKGGHFPRHPPMHGGHNQGTRRRHGGRPFRPGHGSGSSSEEDRETDRFERRECHEKMSNFERKMRRCPRERRKLELIVGVGAGVFGILILTLIAAVCCRRRSQQNANLQKKREKQREFISSLGVYQVSIGGDEKKSALPDSEAEPTAPEKVDLKMNPDFFNTPPPYTDIDKLEKKLLI